MLCRRKSRAVVGGAGARESNCDTRQWFARELVYRPGGLKGDCQEIMPRCVASRLCGGRARNRERERVESGFDAEIFRMLFALWYVV